MAAGLADENLANGTPLFAPSSDHETLHWRQNPAGTILGDHQQIVPEPTSLAANNGSKANPCLAADILGDWREELIARTDDNKELRIYVSTSPTSHRLPTLMHDRQYRIGVARQNVGYNQPPHPSFYLGAQMETSNTINANAE